MKIKRYFAPNIREAITQVRDELGLDAVILSNTSVEGGVELVAATDYDEALVRQQAAAPASPSPPARAVAARKTAPARANGEAKLMWAQEPVLVDMREELQSLRGLLEQQLSGLAWGELARRHPLRAHLIQSLRALGLHFALAREVAAQVDDRFDPRRAWRQALAILAHRIRVTGDDILEQGGIVALVGPTGVGKTTTVAKLAARFVLRHGARAVGLVSIDRERIGAQEQLRTYGRILGVPVASANDTAVLREAIGAMRDRRLVLIDTAGMSPKDTRLAAQLELLNPSFIPIKSYLVLAATTQLAGLMEATRAFAKTRLQGAIVTKLDEANSLGDLLSILARHALPVAYAAGGQRIPEDLQPARAHHLVGTAVTLSQRARKAYAGQIAKRKQYARN